MRETGQPPSGDQEVYGFVPSLLLPTTVAWHSDTKRAVRCFYCVDFVCLFVYFISKMCFLKYHRHLLGIFMVIFIDEMSNSLLSVVEHSRHNIPEELNFQQRRFEKLKSQYMLLFPIVVFGG